MTIRPRLNVICGRCGRRREGLRHVCRSNSKRKATIRLQPVLGGCSRCGKQYGGRNGGPLTHVCRPRDGDFRRRKAAWNRKIKATASQQKERARTDAVRARERARSRAQIARLKARYEARLATAKAKARTPAKTPATPARPRKPPHDYQSCADKDCQRPVCIAFKEGYRDGHRDGDAEGFKRGWQQGYEKGYRDGYGAGFTAGLASCPGPHGG